MQFKQGGTFTMRVTPGMVQKQYSKNLNSSFAQLSYLNNRTTSLRKFNSAAEDPVGAAKAYSLRREFSRNDDYTSALEDTESLLLTAQSSMTNINSIIQELASEDFIKGVNAPMTQDDRKAIVAKIRKLQEALISNANGKYGDQYMFGGADTDKAPFSIGEDGSLLYKGVNVNTGIHVGTAATAATTTISGTQVDFGQDNGSLLNGYKLNIVDGTGANNVDNNSKTITINLDIAGGATKGDLQNALQGLTGLPSGVNVNDITVKGTATDPVTAGGTGSVLGGKLATNNAANANVNGTNIHFGDKNGDMLNGYTLNINYTPVTPPDLPPPHVVDPNKKVININLASNPPTKQDLQDALQSLTPANGLPAGVDASKITVNGLGTERVAFGTGEITGGEKPIAAGTKFDMNAMAKETRFIDIGLGLTFDRDGKLNTQSVFDASMPGLAFMGFGYDQDGVPKNIYTLMTQIANEFEKPDSDFSIDNVQPFIDGFNKQKNDMLTQLTTSGSKSNFMTYTKTRLKDETINLNQKILDIEYIKPDVAIMDFKMQEFSYMAALQMGTKIIQPTFLDFMR